MRPKSLLIAAVGAIIVAALAFALQARLSRHRLEQELEMARERHERHATEIRALEQRLNAATQEKARLRSAIEAAARKSARGATRVATPREARTTASLTEFRQAMATDPKAQLQHLAERRARYVATTQGFVAKFALDDGTATRLVDNLLRRYEQQLDLGMALEKMPEPLAADEVMKLRQRVEDDYRTAQRALLGDDGYREFDRYERTQAVREFVGQLAGKAAIMGEAINAAQLDALLGLVTSASPPFQAGSSAQIATVEWERVFVVARELLSPAQQELLRAAAVPAWNRQRLEQLARQR